MLCKFIVDPPFIRTVIPKSLLPALSLTNAKRARTATTAVFALYCPLLFLVLLRQGYTLAPMPENRKTRAARARVITKRATAGKEAI